MMNAIADASSLIVLARMNGLSLVEQTLGSVGLTRPVEVEVVTAGKAKGYADAMRVEQAIAGGTLTVIDPTTSEQRQADRLLRQAPSLSRADCTTIACAHERSSLLLIEDQRARRVALAEGVRCVNIQMLPLYGYIHQKLPHDSAREWVTKIGQVMRTDPVVVDALTAAMDEIAQLRGEKRGESS